MCRDQAFRGFNDESVICKGLNEAFKQNIKSETSKFEQVIIKTAKNSAWLRNTFKIIDFKAGPECGTYDFMTVHANNVQTRWQVKCVCENPSRVMFKQDGR